MRICFVAFQFWPSIGGSQAQAEKQARYLQQLGQEVMVITLRHQKSWPSYEECSAVPVIRIGGLYRRNGTLRVDKFAHFLVDLRFFLALWRLRQRYDLIQTLQISPLAFISALIGKLTRKPVIVGLQSTGAHDERMAFPPQESRKRRCTCVAETKGKKPDQLQNEIGGDLAHLVQTSYGGRWMLDYLRKSDVYYRILSSRSYIYLVQHGFRPERMVYIPHGVDIQQFYPPALPRGQFLKNQRAILCVGSLEYGKGIDVLLEAWARMLQMPAAWREGLQPRLYLVGDGDYRETLERLVIQLGIQDHVEFLGVRYDIAWLMQEVWGFVLPSRWEGMSNALLEAMACALPCIATRVSGSEDILEQGVNGLLVEPEQPAHLAYALRLLIEDTALVQQLGWRAYETVLHYYQLDTAMQGCMTFYQYLLRPGQATKRVSRRYVQPVNLYPEEQQYYE